MVSSVLKTTYIYGLIDPRTGGVRYIGKSNNPEQRFHGHLSTNDNTYRSHWINQLKENKLRPSLIILEEVSLDGWIEREQWWIRYFREQGAKLTNSTNGGEGMTNALPEIRMKISKAMSGRVVSEETRKKMSKVFRGRKLSEETKVKIGLAGKGKSRSPEQRQKIAISKKGNKNCLGRYISDETRRKMSISATGNKNNSGRTFSQEHKDKIGLSNRGKRSSLSQEDVIKIRQKVLDGFKQSELAMEYNVPYFTINRIVKYKTFRWVE